MVLNFPGVLEGYQMKVNEVIQEGFFKGLGNAATGIIRFLDKTAGGTGEVGTAAQRAEYQRKITAKALKKMEQVNAGLGRVATENFLDELSRQGVDLRKPDSYDHEYMNQLLKAFTLNFFGSDTDPNIRNYVIAGLNSAELTPPTEFNPSTLRDYFEKANDIRSYVLKNILKLTAQRNARLERDREVRDTEAASDISSTVPAGMQYRFMHPEYPGVEIVIRDNGYFLKQLPRSLAGLVKRDKATGLYPILRADNIAKINNYYNAAADAGSVIEEPAAAL